MKGPSEKALKTWVLALTSVASLMVALDALVVTTALGTIRLDLGASIEALQWTMNTYNLSFAVLLLDRRRTRRPLRPPAHVCRWAQPVRGSVGRLRAGERARRF